jgi:uncharacterized membrane protein YadS
MASKGNKKKSVKKRKAKRKKQKNGFLLMMRQWTLPLFVLLFICISLAATFYLVFLHTPSTPLF